MLLIVHGKDTHSVSECLHIRYIHKRLTNVGTKSDAYILEESRTAKCLCIRRQLNSDF